MIPPLTPPFAPEPDNGARGGFAELVHGNPRLDGCDPK
jgi:hypothetical protein